MQFVKYNNQFATFEFFSIISACLILPINFMLLRRQSSFWAGSWLDYYFRVSLYCLLDLVDDLQYFAVHRVGKMLFNSMFSIVSLFGTYWTFKCC